MAPSKAVPAGKTSAPKKPDAPVDAIMITHPERVRKAALGEER